MNLDKNAFLLNDEYIFSREEIKKIEHFVKLKKKKTPLELITNEASFYDSKFYIDERVLIPRSETELMVDIFKNLKINKRIRILDAGTGSGCIGISLALLNNNYEVFGLDKYYSALEVAKINLKKTKTENFSIIQGDWLKSIKSKSFDYIFANPPYIASNDSHLDELVFEPKEALISDNNGYYDLETIIFESREVLQVGGTLYLEHGYNQFEKINGILKKYDYHKIKSYKDLQGIPRIISGINGY